MRAAWNFARSVASGLAPQPSALQVASITIPSMDPHPRWKMATDFVCHGTRRTALLQYQILEAYLNLAPYGRNIEGAGAASEIYFGKQKPRV